MSLAEKLQGEPKKRKGPRKANRQAAQPSSGIKPDIATEPRKKPKSNAECFKNPLIKVDVQTGKVHVNQMPEHWAGRRCIYDQDTL